MDCAATHEISFALARMKAKHKAARDMLNAQRTRPTGMGAAYYRDWAAHEFRMARFYLQWAREEKRIHNVAA